MHELSIAQAVVSTVVDATAARRVLAVELRIGPMAGVVPDSLRFCWDIVTADTPLAGSRLEVTRVEDGDPRRLEVGSVEIADDDTADDDTADVEPVEAAP